MGQVYAVLFVSEGPLNADEIGESLGISRSNVSISLKELEAWQIVKLTRKFGDRREHYSTLGSVRDISNAVCAERRRREVERTLTMLRQALLEPTATGTIRLLPEPEKRFIRRPASYATAAV
jgi:DNA-binding transcriptional regulator GbsR (MarR family)